jgi:GNAT superfamily N-acetyltransferase
MIRPCRTGDFQDILRVINATAAAYRGVIPEDRWHDPYMTDDELRFEMDDGVVFWCVEEGAGPVAVMGIQDRFDVALVRHAYTCPDMQKTGLGSMLLRHVESLSPRPDVLVGTWKAAHWAVRFYGRNGYQPVTEQEKDTLLRRYWKIPERQVETSVVLRKYLR